MKKQCNDCGAPTSATNTMGYGGTPFCGPCKKQELYRQSVQAEKDWDCCDFADPQTADDGLHICSVCGHRSGPAA